MNRTMAKRRQNTGSTGPDDGGEKKRYPSRENTRYVAVPLALYQLLEKYAQDHSDEDDQKSVSWAARVAIRRFLTGEGYTPQSGTSDDQK